MGYSCTAAASYTMDAISSLLGASGLSNGMPDGGFYERGRENADGAITGTVWKPAPLGRVTRRGGYRVEADGKVTRFPGLKSKLLREAEKIGTQTYQRNHGGFHTVSDWRATRTGIIACLADCWVNPSYFWDDVQACTQAYQREKGITFLVLPALNTAQAIRDFLNGLE